MTSLTDTIDPAQVNFGYITKKVVKRINEYPNHMLSLWKHIKMGITGTAEQGVKWEGGQLKIIVSY